MAEPPINELVRSFAAMARKAPRGLPFRPSDIVTVVEPAPALGGAFASEESRPAFHMRAVLPSKTGRDVFVTLVESSGGRLRIHASTDAAELAGATVRVALGASQPGAVAPPPADNLPPEISARVVLGPSATGCNGEADLGPFAEVRQVIGEGDVRLSVVLVEPRPAPGTGEGPAQAPPVEGSLAHAPWPPWSGCRVETVGPPQAHAHSHVSTAGFLRETGWAMTFGNG
ncbi:MAG: hypothetical protein U0835_21210 [Isosphaeraceae bacterium]